MRPMRNTGPLQEAIQKVGLVRLARGLGVSHQAVRLWQKAGRMPRTEWTGETQYSEKIEALTANQVTRDQLLAKWPAPEQQAA
jgi:hypothetical protein